ncbi:hypothetical protein GCM10022224_020620 [Nonomuraea antimicrobica]|uniref:DUF1963 domain-containing protein n=1 Tax=Nonomuraea antimicrobica TaxID=561173 RepID=A0ABP7BEA9_9ACTN
MTDFTDMVRAHLPSAAADRLIALLRPGIQLSHAKDGDPVVGHLGGSASLPEGVAWPVSPGMRPLSLAVALDCARLAGYEVDMSLPGVGTLLFFVEDEGDGNAVIYVPDGVATVPATRGAAFPEVPLTARTVLTWPEGDQPHLVEAFGGITALYEQVWRHESQGDEFMVAVGDWERTRHGSRHQVGGHAVVLQSPFEVTAAYHAGADWSDKKALYSQARDWVLLLQLDEDMEAGMIWGDGAHMIWGIHIDDLAARDFSKTVFDVQGH